MRLTAVSPFGATDYDEIEAVVVDTTEGRRVVLPEHGDFVGTLDLSEITVLQDGDAQRFWAAFGYVHVYGGDVVLIAQVIEADQESVLGFHDRIVAGRRSGRSRFTVLSDG